MKTETRVDRALVAVVDDEADFRGLVSRWLKQDYEVIGMSDGEDLLTWDWAEPPSLVILDVKMPGVNGFTLCQRLRADPRFAKVPVLFLTGVDSDEGFLLGLDAGASSYMTKPVERKALLQRIREILVPESL